MLSKYGIDIKITCCAKKSKSTGGKGFITLNRLITNWIVI